MHSIEFSSESDISLDTYRRVLEGLTGFTVEIRYSADTSPYCSNPVVVVRVDPDGDLVVCEANDDGSPIEHSTWAIPPDAIRKVVVL